MNYRQITSEERYILATLRRQGFNQSEIARELGRHRSTICRELKRNSARFDGCYRPSKAIERTAGRRSRSRRNQRFTRSDLQRVDSLLRRRFSPEQISGRLRFHRELSISHETIYRHVWRDRILGGSLYTYLRGARKRRRKRYGAYDSRGRLAGKRHISERPLAAELRSEIGHWEIDTVIGKGDHHCLVTIVDRKTGYLVIGKLRARTKEHTNRRTLQLIRRHPQRFKTITADNGTEFHDYAQIEHATGIAFYFATPHHSWERGTNENTNGLIRQYVPKGTSMAKLSQQRCNAIARELNNRPRKRLGFKTPQECFDET
jgi:transposase, IS30 family